MFNNVGGKIKKYAIIMCWLGIFLYVAVGGLMIYAGVTGNQEIQKTLHDVVNFVVKLAGNKNTTIAIAGADSTALLVSGISTIIVGTLLSWTGSFLIYGFGDLVANSAERVALLKKELGI